MINKLDTKATIIAKQYFGIDFNEIYPVDGGRNGRTYCVISGGEKYALKFFRTNSKDDRARITNEKYALDFFKKHNFKNTPFIIDLNKKKNCIITNWIGGISIKLIDPNVIKSMLNFLTNIHEKYLLNCNDVYQEATDSCFNGNDIHRQIRNRLINLSSNSKIDSELSFFLKKDLIPSYKKIKVWSKQYSEKYNYDPNKIITKEERTLSPVDFGIHNMIFSKKDYYFIDFEFFGLDDPVKLVSDTLLHPGFYISDKFYDILKREFVNLYSKNKAFEVRLNALLPLFGIKWCLIMLNPFLSNYISNEKNDDLLKKKQLFKCRKKLEFILNNYKINEK